MATRSKRAIVSGNSSFFKRNLYPIIIFSFSFLLYANTISNYYNLDDELVTRNHKLTSQGVKAIPEIFKSAYYSDEMGYSYEYRPILHTTFAIEHEIFGENSHISHFLNVILFGCLSVLLYLLLTYMFANSGYPLLPLIVTLLFSAHPIHTEVVASIKNRDELLAAFFILLSLYSFFRLKKKHVLLAFLVCSLFFVAALLSKITVLSFAIIIPCVGYLFVKRKILLAAFLSFIMIVWVLALAQQDNFSLNIKVLFLTPLSVIVFGLIVNRQYFVAHFATAAARLIQLQKELVLPFLRGFLKKTIVQQIFVAFCFALAIIFGGLFFLKAEKAIYSVAALAVVCIIGIGYLENLWLKTILQVPLFICFGILGVASIDRQDGILALLTLLVFLQANEERTGKKRSIILFWIITAATIFLLNRNFTDSSYIISPKKIFLPIFLMLLGSLLLTNRNYIMKFIKAKEGYWLWLFFIGFKIFSAQKNDTYFLLPLLVILVILSIAIYSPTAVQKYFRSPYFLMVPVLLYTLTLWLGHTSLLISPKVEQIQQSRINNSIVSTKAEEPVADNTIRFPAIGPSAVDRPLEFVEVPVFANNPLIYSTAIDVMARYLKLVVVPYPLAFYYGYKEIEAVKFSNARVIIGAIVYLLLGLLLLYAMLAQQYILTVGLLVYLVGMVPFSNVVNSIPGMIGERYLFLPSLGFCICLGWVVVKVFSVTTDKISEVPLFPKLGLVGVLLVYSGLTFARNNDWKDDLTLMRKDIKTVAQSAQANNLLASHLMMHAQDEADPATQTELTKEALMHYKRALEIYPPFFNVAYEIGIVYARLNMPDSAIAAFRYALTIDTTYKEVQNQLAELLYARGKLQEAVPYYQSVINTNSNQYLPYARLGFIYFKANSFEKSIQVYKQAIRYMPMLVEPRMNIAKIYLNMNQADSAREYATQVIAIESTNAEALNFLHQLGQK